MRSSLVDGARCACRKGASFAIRGHLGSPGRTGAVGSLWFRLQRPVARMSSAGWVAAVSPRTPRGASASSVPKHHDSGRACLVVDGDVTCCAGLSWPRRWVRGRRGIVDAGHGLLADLARQTIESDFDRCDHIPCGSGQTRGRTSALAGAPLQASFHVAKQRADGCNPGLWRLWRHSQLVPNPSAPGSMGE